MGVAEEDVGRWIEAGVGVGATRIVAVAVEEMRGPGALVGAVVELRGGVGTGLVAGPAGDAAIPDGESAGAAVRTFVDAAGAGVAAAVADLGVSLSTLAPVV